MNKNILTRTYNYLKKYGFLKAFLSSINELKHILTVRSRRILAKIDEISKIFTVGYHIQKRRVYLTHWLSDKMRHTVEYGPLKGFNFKYHDDWDGSFFLGLYEKEILEYLNTIPKSHSTLINIGASDGDYAVGCVYAKIFQRAYCYEILKKSKENIKKNALLNGVSNLIKVYGTAKEDFLSLLLRDNVDLSKSVVLCDAEGSEFNIFNSENLSKLKESYLIIEIHDWHKNGSRNLANLLKRSNKYFNVKKIFIGPRNPSDFPELDQLRDNDRWLICSDGRHYKQTWLILEPKIHAKGKNV